MRLYTCFVFALFAVACGTEDPGVVDEHNTPPGVSGGSSGQTTSSSMQSESVQTGSSSSSSGLVSSSQPVSEMPGSSSQPDSSSTENSSGSSSSFGSSSSVDVTDYELAHWPLPADQPVGYTVAGDLAVDQTTGLVWQRATVLVDSRVGAISVCSALELGGFDDWRLPTRRELFSLIDFSRQTPAINTSAFPATSSAGYWASTMVDDDQGTNGWMVNFDSGQTERTDVNQPGFVRCIRFTTSEILPQVVFNAESIVDTTGLEWQRGVPPIRGSRADAVAFCTDSGNGWRIPTMRELETLVDVRANTPAFNVAAFNHTWSSGFWTTTPHSNDDTKGWVIMFDYGDSTIVPRGPDPGYFIRCVR